MNKQLRLEQVHQELVQQHQQLEQQLAASWQQTYGYQPAQVHVTNVTQELEQFLLAPLRLINPYYFNPLRGEWMQENANRKDSYRPSVAELICRWRKVNSGLTVDELNDELMQSII